MSQRIWLVGIGLLFGGGCVERTMTIKTDPPGALVYLNDQELGRTPLKRDFTWYGDYDVEIRKEGYQPLHTHKWVTAPWYQWVPFDLAAEIQPGTVKDHHELFFKLEPQEAVAVNPSDVMGRAEALKDQLEGSRFTRPPTTRPTTQPATKPPR